MEVGKFGKRRLQAFLELKKLTVDGGLLILKAIHLFTKR
jgi:hypothetical protein